MCVNTTQYLYERMVTIQNKTAKLREKIGCECGEKFGMRGIGNNVNWKEKHK